MCSPLCPSSHHVSPPARFGVQTGCGFIQQRLLVSTDLPPGGDTQHPLPGWVSPPQPRGHRYISLPCPPCAAPTPPGGAQPEELVSGSLLGGNLPSPPSVPSAAPGSSTRSRPGAGNAASPAGPACSPWVRMFLEITAGTGDTGGWLQPPPPAPAAPHAPRYLWWVCHRPRRPPSPAGRGCSWGRG